MNMITTYKNNYVSLDYLSVGRTVTILEAIGHLFNNNIDIGTEFNIEKIEVCDKDSYCDSCNTNYRCFYLSSKDGKSKVNSCYYNIGTVLGDPLI